VDSLAIVAERAPSNLSGVVDQFSDYPSRRRSSSVQLEKLLGLFKRGLGCVCYLAPLAAHSSLAPHS